jgi:hypothetical protein
LSGNGNDLPLSGNGNDLLLSGNGLLKLPNLIRELFFT